MRRHQMQHNQNCQENCGYCQYLKSTEIEEVKKDKEEGALFAWDEGSVTI